MDFEVMWPPSPSDEVEHEFDFEYSDSEDFVNDDVSRMHQAVVAFCNY